MREVTYEERWDNWPFIFVSPPWYDFHPIARARWVSRIMQDTVGVRG